MPGGGGDAGIGAFPACKRASSSWFSWSAVLPVNCGALPRWCAAILPWAIWRAWRWLGGIAEVLSGIAVSAEGAIAAGGGLRLVHPPFFKELQMEYRHLGASGFTVPVLSFGTGTFGGKGDLFKARFPDDCRAA